ncbi:MAG: molybdopterin-dependent oxidoreductase [Candidatus Tectomicrobia bacterium]|nr:molybdopterin-dependent oxidoreductase [Candidatus Tectomicrobia bacterium]
MAATVTTSAAETTTVPMVMNGQRLEREVDPERSLLDFIREDLRLTGSKNGCDIGQCGSCTVIMNGKAVRACITPLGKCRNATIETIEHIGAPDNLHPLQAGFLVHQGSQCGFCTPGQIMTAKALLDKNSNPTPAEVKKALTGNLCRCTGYQQILESVLDAARVIREKRSAKELLEPHIFDPSRWKVVSSDGAPTTHLVGTSAVRVDGIANVTGRSKYTEDLDEMVGALYMHTVRTEHPHAKMLSLDTTAAEKYPGVVAVFTAKDIPGENAYGKAIRDQEVLVRDYIRSIGDAICLVAAENETIAKEAGKLVKIAYEVLEPLDTVEKAMDLSAPELHEKVQTTGWTISRDAFETGQKRKNVLFSMPIRKGDVRKGFAAADVIVENWYETQPQDHAPMEPECGVAFYNADGILTVKAPTQHVYFDRLNIARALGLNNHEIIVLQPSVGGAFGKREDVYGQIHVALCAMKLKRPVKTVYSREESILATQKRHAHKARIRSGIRRDGRIVAWEAEIYGDTGAYASWGQNVLRKSAVHCTGPYEIDNVHVDAYAVYTTNPFRGAIRGFGVAQVAFMFEAQIDELAKGIGMDPLEVRRLNSLRKGSRTSTNMELKSNVAGLQCLEQAAAAFDWANRESRRAHPDPLIRKGFGIGNIWYGIGFGGGLPDQGNSIIEVFPDGTATVWVSTTDYGQGSNTIFAQITAEQLGLKLEDVRLHTGDSVASPNCGSTVATRQTYVTGSAISETAAMIRHDLLRLASRTLEVDEADLELRDGYATTKGSPTHRIAVKELIKKFDENGLPRRRQRLFKCERHTTALDPKTGFGNAYWPITWGCHMAEVEVNIKTGRVKVVRMVAAHYLGKAINPQSVRGQILGGLSMGFGYALSEDIDLQGSVPQAINFDKYHTMRIKDLPDDLVSIIVEVDDDGRPSEIGPYGALGIGEPPTVAACPAITNAIADALGSRIHRIPQTPKRVAQQTREIGLYS